MVDMTRRQHHLGHAHPGVINDVRPSGRCTGAVLPTGTRAVPPPAVRQAAYGLTMRAATLFAAATRAPKADLAALRWASRLDRTSGFPDGSAYGMTGCQRHESARMRIPAPFLVLLQSSVEDKDVAASGCSQAAMPNSEFTKAAWATMSSPPTPFTCPFLIIAKASYPTRVHHARTEGPSARKCTVDNPHAMRAPSREENVAGRWSFHRSDPRCCHGDRAETGNSLVASYPGR
jgi:hypothetical protein